MRPILALAIGGVDSWLDSAHKCGIATLAVEYHLESSAKIAERDTGQRLPRELPGRLSNVNERLDATVQQALAGLRSTHPPAQSLE